MKLVAIAVALAVVISVAVLILKGRPLSSTHANAAEFPPEVVERLNEARAAREKVRSKDPQFFAAVSNAMFEHDPISINFKTNTDEYEAEAGTVIPRLAACSSADEVVTVVYEEFEKWFGKDIAGDRSRYIELAKDIWALWQKRGPNPSFNTDWRDKAAPAG